MKKIVGLVAGVKEVISLADKWSQRQRPLRWIDLPRTRLIRQNHRLNFFTTRDQLAAVAEQVMPLTCVGGSWVRIPVSGKFFFREISVKECLYNYLVLNLHIKHVTDE